MVLIVLHAILLFMLLSVVWFAVKFACEFVQASKAFMQFVTALLTIMWVIWVIEKLMLLQGAVPK